ncbi:hypothetical protein BT93_L0606 [Corymbia citriodora subsp. variegata]|uniref:Uncharacterized protein n=1 Tax=Corymbia citriodora subsp. variegata TaxID=360336 RepID=A0A8T0CXE0_CORYI|nr:hypothetical protein BT93_L0606 [Corymbia citriodora subsp. variegata]KAF7852100.1 hypothetical protein BT93_L0606 [Corymbia citriodora subsp. variegata]
MLTLELAYCPLLRFGIRTETAWVLVKCGAWLVLPGQSLKAAERANACLHHLPVSRKG